MNTGRCHNILQTLLSSLDYTFRRLQPLEVHTVDSVMSGEPCVGDYKDGGARGVVGLTYLLTYSTVQSPS